VDVSTEHETIFAVLDHEAEYELHARICRAPERAPRVELTVHDMDGDCKRLAWLLIGPEAARRLAGALDALATQVEVETP
jgi:hypothetical protein